MQHSTENILKFLHATEGLKHELRHSWTSSGRQESVADHSWRLSLMLIICAPYLEKQINLLKALKLAIFHDIAEAKIGDKHYLDVIQNENAKNERLHLENQAVKELAQLLGNNGTFIPALWEEFENRTCEEAKVVYFLDKLEACIQHNEADISTWTEREIASVQEYFNALEIEDNFLLSLKKAVKDETMKKIHSYTHCPS